MCGRIVCKGNDDGIKWLCRCCDGVLLEEVR